MARAVQQGVIKGPCDVGAGYDLRESTQQSIIQVIGALEKGS